MMPAHVGEGGSSLLSLLNEIPVPSKNPLTDTPPNSILPAIWTSLSLVKLRHKFSSNLSETKSLADKSPCDIVTHVS